MILCTPTATRLPSFDSYARTYGGTVSVYGIYCTLGDGRRDNPVRGGSSAPPVSFKFNLLRRRRRRRRRRSPVPRHQVSLRYIPAGTLITITPQQRGEQQRHDEIGSITETSIVKNILYRYDKTKTGEEKNTTTTTTTQQSK